MHSRLKRLDLAPSQVDADEEFSEAFGGWPSGVLNRR